MPDWLSTWLDKLYETFVENGYYLQMLGGLKNTIYMTLGALLIGVLGGALIAVIKFFAEDTRALKPLAKICDISVTVIRGIPVVVLLLIFYFVIMEKTKEGVIVGIVTFGVNSSAYMAELIRSGINAVNVGQMEAGRSLGLSRLQTMRKIILPQAVRYILPAIGNEMIALLKETSVAGYVAVTDLTKAGSVIRNVTYDSVNTLLIVALTYLVMVVILTQLLSMAERRLAKSDKR